MIEAIVLAAGLATRMGAIKPLTPVDGEPALATVLRRLKASGIVRPIIVLGSPSVGAIANAVDLSGSAVVENDDPEAGMARSLRLGLDATARDAAGALILHADMPFVRGETIGAVLRASEEGATIAAPTFGDRRGFPVFFHASCFAGLREALSGDSGGRAYITAHRELLTTVPVDDPGCVYDIDRPEDVAAWKGDRACASSV